jgi:hypothetical protein
MAQHDDPGTAALQDAAAAYSTHAEGQRSAREAKHKEDLEAQAASPIQSTGGLESVDAPLAEEARFVANPENLRKEVDSEEKFSEGLTNNPVEVEVGGETVTDPVESKPEPESDSGKPPTKAAAKAPAAAKKTAAKKGSAKK